MIELTIAEFISTMSYLPNPIKYSMEKRDTSLVEIHVVKEGARVKRMELIDIDSNSLNRTTLMSGVERIQFKLNTFDYSLPRWEPVQEIKIKKYNNDSEKKWRESLIK